MPRQVEILRTATCALSAAPRPVSAALPPPLACLDQHRLGSRPQLQVARHVGAGCNSCGWPERRGGPAGGPRRVRGGCQRRDRLFQVCQPFTDAGALPEHGFHQRLRDGLHGRWADCLGGCWSGEQATQRSGERATQQTTFVRAPPPICRRCHTPLAAVRLHAGTLLPPLLRFRVPGCALASSSSRRR